MYEIDDSAIANVVVVAFPDDDSDLKSPATREFSLVQASAAILIKPETLVLRKVSSTNGFQVMRIELNKLETAMSSFPDKDDFAKSYFSVCRTLFLDAIAYGKECFLTIFAV